MDHNSAEYVNFKMQAVKVEGPPQIEAETVVKMQDGKTFIFEEDDMDERGAETVVKTQDGKTFIFEEDDMDERGAVPPAGYDPRSMDHNSAEYINLKMQALEERDTPVHPLPNAKTVSMTPQDDVMDERGAVPPAGYDPRSMDHSSAEYINFKMQAVKVEGPPQIEAE